MIRRHLLLTTIAIFVIAPSARAAILEDFQFNDPAGTLIENAVNSAGTGHMFDVDSDLDGVTTNGMGQYNASLKSNTAFGSTYVNLDPDIATGSLYGVIELTYDFDPMTLDPTENEEIRLSLIRDDPRATFVTAEVEIERTDANDVIIFGNAIGDGSVDTSTDILGLTQSEILVGVVAVNLDSDLLQVHYSLDAAASFTSLTDGTLDPTRGVASMRLVLNNDLSQDSVLLHRVYLSDTNPFPGLIPDVPEPGALGLFGLGIFCLVARRVSFLAKQRL